MALEGVKSEKSEENNGNLPDGKANGIDNKSKQVRIQYDFRDILNRIRVIKRLNLSIIIF